MVTSTTTATPNRWHIAAAGVLMQLTLGTVYAWSVLKRPFMATHGWSNTEVGLAFTLVILFIGLAAAFGGGLVDRTSARVVSSIAALLFALGTLLTGVAASTGSLWLLWMGYGVIAGIGNGLAYITPLAVLVRWFPDRRGLITGLAVMGFGFGAAILGQVAPFMVPTTTKVLVDGAVGYEITQANFGLANSFYLLSAVFLVVLLGSAQLLKNPPEGWVPPTRRDPKGRMPDTTSVPVSQALRMVQFYLLFAVLCINVTAGIALISNLSTMAQDATGIGPVAAGSVVFAASLFNGLGRIFWSWLSDRLGRKLVFALILGTQVPLLLLLPQVSNSYLFAALSCYVLSCYGGGFSTMPAYAADTFGARYIGGIYGKLLLAWGVAGVLGPQLMELIKNTSGDFRIALYAAAALLVVGFVLNLLYQQPNAAPSAR